MPTPKISFSELTHTVVRQASGPLTPDEIQAAVAAITPITTRNPKQTIRNAISSSPMILSTGDGRYDWKYRLINAATNSRRPNWPTAGCTDDHLYSFFMSGTTWDRASEIGSPWTDCAVHTHQVEIGSLGLTPGQKFLYLFDYGDNHEFNVTLLAIDPLAPKGDYPRTLEYHGTAPQQYPEDDEDEAWNPRAQWSS